MIPRGYAENSKDIPFRVWYSKLDELRSIMKHTNFLAFSATVSASTKLKIYSLLSFDFANTFCVIKSPLKSNLKYSVNYIEKAKVDEIFDQLICTFKEKLSKNPDNMSEKKAGCHFIPSFF